MKLVVSGQTADGTSVIVEDDVRQPVVASGFPTLSNTPLWAAAGAPTLPQDGTRPALHQFFPPPGGYRFFLLTIEPDSHPGTQQQPTADQLAEFAELFPGLMEKYEPDVPGMHRTDSIDFGVILSGSVVLEVDNQVERTLHAGDAFIQNGTRHRWRVPGATPATMAVFILGVNRVT